jgi:hypothetical protein
MDRLHRCRQGISRPRSRTCLKLETIGQAIELGIQLVKTDNDVENLAILHINESLGYEPMPGFISYLKGIG